MLRSETLNYYSITFSYDSSFDAIEELARTGGIHLDDLQFNQPGRPFASQATETSERLLQLAEIETLLLENSLLSAKLQFDKRQTLSILEKARGSKKGISISQANLLDEFVAKHSSIYKLIANKQNIRSNLASIQETIDALEAISSALPTKEEFPGPEGTGLLGCLVYVVDNKNLKMAQRLLFRVSRGHALASYFPAKHADKTIVLLAFLQSQGEFLVDRLKKSLENSGARAVRLPQSVFGIAEYVTTANRTRLDALKTIDRTREKIFGLLTWFCEEGEVPGISRIYESKVLLLKQRELFTWLGFFLRSGEILEGRFWVSKQEEKRVFEEISFAAQKKHFQAFRILKLSISKYDEVPPSKFLKIPFLANFQEIVNTYGVPRYKEVNPGIFTTVTFPFLFGVMFGDVGHGLLLWAFGMAVAARPSLLGGSLFHYKHLISAMGFFAFYCGLVYNEFFSLPLIFIESCYEQKDFKRIGDCFFPFGIDQAWHASKAGIGFLNSYKMKISIVYGVLHMTLGILLKGLNSIFFRDAVTFLFEFLPQLIFFLCTFGYMSFCIIVKWLTDFAGAKREPPSIIALFINFVSGIDYVLFLTEDDQIVLQRLLALVAAFCVPVLFFGKPFFNALLRLCRPRKRNYSAYSYQSIDVPQNALLDEEEQNLNESFDSVLIYSVSKNKPAHKVARLREQHAGFSEELIHQAIETIEFVLGSISNTASYLRLWALSLAHNQLAKVFFDMLLRPFLSGQSGIFQGGLFIVLGFVFFFSATFGVLMCMDVMECFLHALRLHWVEFQNKFYKGDGYEFDDFELLASIKKGFL